MRGTWGSSERRGGNQGRRGSGGKLAACVGDGDNPLGISKGWGQHGWSEGCTTLRVAPDALPDIAYATSSSLAAPRTRRARRVCCFSSRVPVGVSPPTRQPSTSRARRGQGRMPSTTQAPLHTPPYTLASPSDSNPSPYSTVMQLVRTGRLQPPAARNAKCRCPEKSP